MFRIGQAHPINTHKSSDLSATRVLRGDPRSSLRGEGRKPWDLKESRKEGFSGWRVHFSLGAKLWKSEPKPPSEAPVYIS